MQCKQFGICRHVLLHLELHLAIAHPFECGLWLAVGQSMTVMDTRAISGSDEAARTLVEKFLHPRMTCEHVNSGGGACMSPRIRSLLPGRRFVGRALTARTLPGFTRRAIEALALTKPNDVLVIDAGGVSEL